MKRLRGIAAVAAVWMLAGMAGATTYYVDATNGDDTRDGQSTTTAWKTIAKVNAATLAAGDQVLFKRGEAWRESLVPPSSGTAGNTIKFDAYGAGEAPTITGALPLSVAAWSVDSGNVWKASVTGNTLNFVVFGTIWGNKQTAKANVLANRDWYFAVNTLYVYSQGNPASYYGSVSAIVLAGSQMIYVNGKSYLDIQHFRVTFFDTYGVRIGGASDHINVANVYVDSQVPNGTLPHGFYVNATPSPGDINFYNDDAHRSYNGFRIDGSATQVQIKNCRGYANRNNGLNDSTGNARYSYSHFYANNLAIMSSQDVVGGVDAGNNIPNGTWPAVMTWARYPARVSFTVDDIGLVAGAETYVDSLLPVFTSRGLALSVGVVTGYSSGLASKIQSWAAGGHDVNSHSWSHQYYTNPTAFTIQYTGTGTAATLTISGNHLRTTITGGAGGENLDLDLTNAAYATISKVVGTLTGRGVYAAAVDANCQGAAHSIGLADVTAQNIMSTYSSQFQKDRLEQDEMGASKTWLQTNIAGLNAKVYVYPDGLEDTQTQGWAVAAGFEGARGGLSMGLGAKEVYGAGVNLQDITSFGTVSLHGMTQQQISATMAALVFKASIWGVPYGLFCHNNNLTTAEMGYVLDGLVQNGATMMTNTQIADAVYAMSRVGSGTYYVSAAGADPDLRPSLASPTLNAGADLGAAFKYDLEGVDQSAFGLRWEIGPYAYVPFMPYLVVVH